MLIDITNNEDECYDLIDMDSDQSHDGDGSKQLIAKVYEKIDADLIANFLNIRM